MILPIRLYGDPVLRRSARAVRTFDDALRALADDMIETMHDANGVGLAAPQVGVSLRLFVALELEPDGGHDGDEVERGHPNSSETNPGDAAASRGLEIDDDRDQHDQDEDERPESSRVLATHVMVNPVITQAEGVQFAPDGCLSVPGLWFEDMKRDAQVTVTYQDLDGANHERKADGHFAHVIQHELDHLDGIFYFDRLADDERRAFMDTHRQELADMQRQAKVMLKQLTSAS